MNEIKKKIALVPGSFDPFTVGHRYVAQRAASVFDKVFVAVMINDAKQYMFTAEQRVEIAKRSLSDLTNVEVIYDGGMLVDLFDKISASAIVKGIRNGEDLAYENEMARYNLEKNPRAITLYVPSDPRVELVSSTLVRSNSDSPELFAECICEGARDYVLDILKK